MYQPVYGTPNVFNLHERGLFTTHCPYTGTSKTPLIGPNGTMEKGEILKALPLFRRVHGSSPFNHHGISKQ